VLLGQELDSNITRYVLDNNLMVIGGITRDNAGKLKAMALVSYYVDNNRQGLSLRETHFDDTGSVSFVAISSINPISGEKISEESVLCQKTAEYYPIWAGSCPGGCK